MIIVALDLGSRTCGVAKSDLSQSLAFGVRTLRFNEGDYEAAITLATAVCEEIQAGMVIIGYPLLLNGDRGPQALLAERFAEVLREEVSIPVELWDERFTTVMAQKTLIATDASRRKRRKVVDTVAAEYILQSYLDAKRKETNGN